MATKAKIKEWREYTERVLAQSRVCGPDCQSCLKDIKAALDEGERLMREAACSPETFAPGTEVWGYSETEGKEYRVRGRYLDVRDDGEHMVAMSDGAYEQWLGMCTIRDGEVIACERVVAADPDDELWEEELMAGSGAHRD